MDAPYFAFRGRKKGDLAEIVAAKGMGEVFHAPRGKETGAKDYWTRMALGTMRWP